MVWAWVALVLSAGVILWSGRRLVGAAETIAEATGLSRGWIGFILVGLVTSLPELVVTMTGGGIEAPAIAVGNALGSNAFNIGILGVAGLAVGGGLFARLSTSHASSAGMGIVMSAVVLGSIALGGGPSLGSLSVTSLLLVALFFAAAWLQYRATPSTHNEHRPTMGRTPWVAAGSAVLVIAAGVALTFAARELSIATGIGQSLMGSTLVAMGTSLPEVASSWEAVRLRSFDMLAGSIFGSNVFNVFTVFFTDLAYGQPVLGGLGDDAWSLILVGSWGITAASVALIALGVRAKARVGRVDVASGLIIAAYLFGLAIVTSRGLNI